MAAVETSAENSTVPWKLPASMVVYPRKFPLEASVEISIEISTEDSVEAASMEAFTTSAAWKLPWKFGLDLLPLYVAEASCASMKTRES